LVSYVLLLLLLFKKLITRNKITVSNCRRYNSIVFCFGKCGLVKTIILLKEANLSNKINDKNLIKSSALKKK